MSVGVRPPSIQRPVNIGPYIIGAAAIHAAILVGGVFLFVEYQKFQVANAIYNAEVSRLERQAAEKKERMKYDEPEDRRGLK